MTEATKVAIFFVIILPASVWLVMICRTLLAFMLRAWVARSRAPEPSPCPSCGRRGPTVGDGVKPIGGQPRITFQVLCESCEMSGPSAFSRAYAVRQWNLLVRI